MKAHQIKLYTDIKMDGELTEFVSQPGLIVLNVYSQWCGPCISMNIMFLEMKLDKFGQSLHLATCDSDTVNTLERFNRTSEPIWLFVRNGKAINIMFGSEADELQTKVWAELNYLVWGIERPSYELDELQPVEIEISELVADISVLQWKKDQKPHLKKLKKVTDDIIDFMPQIHVTIFGPHIQTSWRDIIKRAESLGIHCHDRRLITPTMEVFNYINYACTNPLDEKVINEFVNNHIMLCLWHLPVSCTTEDESNALIEQFKSILQSDGESSLLTDRTNLPLSPNIVVQRKVTNFEMEQDNFYAEIVAKYFDVIKALIASLPCMELTEYNCLRMSELVFNAHLGKSPYLKYSPISYEEPVKPIEFEVENYAILNAQKDEFMSRIVIRHNTPQHVLKDVTEAKFGKFFARNSNQSFSKESDIFGEEGMDEDLTYLLDYLEEEEDDDNVERLSGGSLQEVHLELLELPGMWHPQGARARAALINIYFPSHITHFWDDVDIKKHKQLVMAFQADKLTKTFVHTMDKRKDNIINFGFFNGDDPEEAEFICDEIIDYVHDNPNNPDDRVVMTVDYEKPETAFDLVQLKPTYVSPNEIYGQEDDDLFFGEETPIIVDHDFIGFLERQKLNFNLWKESQNKMSSPKKCEFFARSHYRVPVYKSVANIFDGNVSMLDKPKTKEWYSYQLNDFLYNNRLRDSLSETSLAWNKRPTARQTQRGFATQLGDVTSMQALSDFVGDSSELLIKEQTEEMSMAMECELEYAVMTLDQNIEEVMMEESSLNELSQLRDQN